MQFYGLFEKIINYIPDSFTIVREYIYIALPFVLMACALFTAFFGLKCAGLWCAATFFGIGTSLTAYYILPAVNYNDVMFWIMGGVCLLVGILCAYFSKYLFRAQLVVSNFALVYASLPAFIVFLGDIPSKIVSAIVAGAMAFLNIKYKYLFVLLTTSFSGSFIFWEVIENRYNIKYTFVYAIIMGVLAFAFQCYMNRKQIKDTYKDVKKKYKKTKDEGEKIITKLEDEFEKEKEKLSHHNNNDDEMNQTEIDYEKEESACEKE